MICRTVLCILLLTSSMKLLAQGTFYSTDTIREIRINFAQSNWDDVLDSLYIAGEKERMQATLFIDGVQYDSVGVRYKGYSSSSVDRVKNPFNIKLNHLIEGQDHLGIDKIKLSNVIQDPSFLREVLSYEIARKYMPASESNFANVYVNDTLLGLYSNVEAVNNEFLEKHYSSASNVLVKGNPETVDLYGENSNLSQTPGADSMAYTSLYSMKSDFGWTALYNFIDTLNNFEADIEQVLNVDQALWMHALNYTLINFDSYVGYAQNYYLYQDESGRFNPIIWDLNMSFGSFRLTDASVYYDGFSIEQAKTIDPLSHYHEFSVFPRPLLRNLFNNSSYRKMYLAHIRTLVEENFSNQDYIARAETFRALIDESVQNDTNKFYSYDDFQNNFYATVTDLIDYPGIVDLMDGRTSYLSSYLGFQGAPEIENVSSIPEEHIANDSLLISAQVSNASEVIIAYRSVPDLLFEKAPMNDEGIDGDEIAGDGVFSTRLMFLGRNLDYYIYAENDTAGAFSPERATYEYYTVLAELNPGDLVINELMASNIDVVPGQNQEYDDWIELYNTTQNTLSAGGLFLSDDLNNLSKWALPEQEIPAGAYLIVWADSDLEQEGNHANFKLSSLGEQLFLSDANQALIDSISFPEQIENISYGRRPNGIGEFTFLSPTFEASNDQANLIPLNDALIFKLYPNPIWDYDELFIDLESQANSTIQIIDVLGRVVLERSVSAGITSTILSTSEIISGLYIVTVKSGNNVASKKMVKR